MTPEEIKRWQTENGGAAGEPETDANGITTHRAANGNYITVRPDGSLAMRGFRPPAEGSTAQQQAAPSAQPTTPSSGVGAVSQQQLEQRLAQNPNFVYRGQTTRTQTTPADAFGPGQTIQVPVVTWVDPTTGHTLAAEVQPGGGGYVITTDAAVPSNRLSTNQQATVGRVEGTPLPGGGHDNTKPIWVERDQNGQQVGPAKPLTADQRQQWERDKNDGLTDEQVRQQNSPEARIGKPTGRTDTITKNGQTVKRTEYLLPDGTKEWREQTETVEPDRIGKPTGNTRTKTEGGQTIKETEYVLPDGKTEWRAQTEQVADQTMPANLPQFTPDINRPALGLVEYTRTVYVLAAQKKPDGTPYLTPQQVKEALAIAHQQATTEATRLDNIRASQAQQQTNAINQRNADQNAAISRGGLANTATDNAFKTAASLAGAMTEKNFTPGLLPAILGLQDQRQQQWGGMGGPIQPQVTTEGYPMLQGLNQLGLPPSAAATEQAAVNGGIASPEAQGLLAQNAANGQFAQAQAAPPAPPMTPALGPPPQMPGQTPVQPPAPTPPAVPGMPSPLGDTGAPPIGMAPPMPGLPGMPQAQQPGMQVQHPVIQNVLGQNQDPAWAQAVQQAAREMGLVA